MITVAWKKKIRDELFDIISDDYSVNGAVSKTLDTLESLIRRELKEFSNELFVSVEFDDSSILCIKPAWLKEVLKDRGIE